MMAFSLSLGNCSFIWKRGKSCTSLLYQLVCFQADDEAWRSQLPIARANRKRKILRDSRSCVTINISNTISHYVDGIPSVKPCTYDISPTIWCRDVMILLLTHLLLLTFGLTVPSQWQSHNIPCNSRANISQEDLLICLLDRNQLLESPYSRSLVWHIAQEAMSLSYCLVQPNFLY